MTTEARLAHAIESRTARIVVIDQGYVDLPLAVEFARAGFHVVGIDADPDRVAAITVGQSPGPDVPADDIRREVTARSDATDGSEVVVICVPTPLTKSKDPRHLVVAAACGGGQPSATGHADRARIDDVPRHDGRLAGPAVRGA